MTCRGPLNCTSGFKKNASNHLMERTKLVLGDGYSDFIDVVTYRPCDGIGMGVIDAVQ